MMDGCTQILDILIGKQGDKACGFALSRACPVALVDDDAVCCSRRDEGSAVGEAGPAGVVVECNVGQSIADSAKQKGDVSGEPSKLKCLHKTQHTLLER